ncbi:MAG: exopolysaccharide biosynthesis polyprenyl glycosylphosphotransferase, partial [Elusimicrobia bacterium]|nr:exopolysaccharide biosynthesis polyprenyl glycosylphosphotransferase [Elusimicrobiota bacterium]
MKKFTKQFIIAFTQYGIHLAIFPLCFWAAFAARFYSPLITYFFPPIKGIPYWADYWEAIPIVLTIWTIVAFFSNYYTTKKMSLYDDFLHTLKNVTLTFIIVMAITFLYRKVEYSRLVFMSAWGLAFVSIFVSRVVFSYIESWFLHRVFGKHRILVLGKGKSQKFLRDYLENKKTFKSYFYDTIKSEKTFERFIKRHRVDEVIVVNVDVSHEKLLKLASICDQKNIDFKFVPDIFELRMGELIVDHSFGLPVFYLKPISLHSFNFYYKRVFDILVSIGAIGFFFIPLALICYLIKIETPGPIFYLQKRIGFKSRSFLFYKFRTMVDGADLMIDEIKHLSERIGPVFKMRNDPRVTRIGKLLRAFSIDEVPQIINVLKGEMSIIGPRPQVVWEAQAYDEKAKKRLNVLPGITGLWQVSGRANLSYNEMIQLDLFYIENWSPGLDIKIVMETV